MLKTGLIVSARHGCGWRREREVRSISRQQWEYDKLMRQQRPHLHLQQNTNKNTKQNTENKNLPCRWQLASTSSASYLGLSLRLCLWLRIPAAKTKININNAQIYKHKSSGCCCCFFCSSICDPKNRNMPRCRVLWGVKVRRTTKDHRHAERVQQIRGMWARRVERKSPTSIMQPGK